MLEQLFAACATFGTSFYAWHFLFLLLRPCERIRISISNTALPCGRESSRGSAPQILQTGRQKDPAPTEIRERKTGLSRITADCVPNVAWGQPAGRHPL